MTNSSASAPHFTCPGCGTLYTVVPVEADDSSDDRDIACPTCGAALPARDGKFVLKYFRLRRIGTPDRGRYTVV